MKTNSEGLLITGGVLRPQGYDLGEGKYYGGARLLHLDTRSSHVKTLLAVDEGTPNFPAEHPNLEFTEGCSEGATLWLAMDTEIGAMPTPRCNCRPRFRTPASTISIRWPCAVAACSSLPRGWTWWWCCARKPARCSRCYTPTANHPGTALRKTRTGARCAPRARTTAIPTTSSGWQEPWVTRCTQEDAVPLHHPDRRIDLSGAKREISVHDGVVHGGGVFFTLVDGTVVVMDAADPERPLRNIELASLPGFGGVRGWCRGLCFPAGLAYVGFSRLRRTRDQSKLDWVRRAVGRGETVQQASVLAVDLQAGRIVKDYRLELGSTDAVYGIMTAPRAGH